MDQLSRKNGISLQNRVCAGAGNAVEWDPVTQEEKKKDARDRTEQSGEVPALILRHKPEAAGITLDEHGWADTQQLIAGIAAEQYVGGRAPLDERARVVDDHVIRLKIGKHFAVFIVKV